MVLSLFDKAANNPKFTDENKPPDYDNSTALMTRNKVALGLLLLAIIAAAGAQILLRHPATRSRVTTMFSISSAHSVTLKWDASPGANFYYIYRSSVSGTQYQKIGSSLTTSYKDEPVPSKAVFYYVVTAVGDHAESRYSNEIKAVVP